jgi:hypothetical protein
VRHNKPSVCDTPLSFNYTFAVFLKLKAEICHQATLDERLMENLSSGVDRGITYSRDFAQLFAAV